MTELKEKNSQQKVYVEGKNPQRIIEAKAEELYQAYLRTNPNDKDPNSLKYVKLRSENAAIVQYLNGLYEKGKL